MRVTRKQLSNALFVISIVVIFFTPLGFQIKVHVNRIFSFNPTELNSEEQHKLTDYNWHLVTLGGTPFEFSETKGKVVLVNFWATWCPPCVAEMPELQKLYDSYSNEVEFVFIAHDEIDKVDNFLKKYGYNLPVYFEKSTSPTALKSKYLPTTYVIDKKGILRIEKAGSASWNSGKTRDLLESLISE